MITAFNSIKPINPKERVEECDLNFLPKKIKIIKDNNGKNKNDDICKRVIDKGGSLYIIPSAKINHGGAKAVDSKFIKEVELSRNWHWVWSKFYFNKKHFSYLKAINVCMLSYFSSIVKMFFYFLIRNDFKRKIYFNRASGFHNAMRGKPSWYRPNLED